MTQTSLLFGAFAFVMVATFSGCSAATDDEGVSDDAAALTDAGSITVGTELVTTARLNFRQGPSTGAAIRRVLAKGTKVVVVNQATPTGAFYNVRQGADEGWVHGGYLARASGAGTGPGTGTVTPPPAGACTERRLTFSADDFPNVPPAGSAYVWGGNATGGGSSLYSSEFRSLAQQAKSRGVQVFAYLEGPCGDTGGVDDGERARCEGIHNSFNAQNAPGTPNTAKARWKPYTMKQLTSSGSVGVDYCEIDNLSNNVTIPLNPLLQEIKALYDAGQIHCRLVLKNVEASDIDSIRANVAPTPAAANFIAPFHIFEADDTGQKAELDAAMVRLKGQGAKTIISTDTNHYGSAFTNDKFLACP